MKTWIQLESQPVMTNETDQSMPCPVWGWEYSVPYEDHNGYRKVYSPRAGGPFRVPINLINDHLLSLNPKEQALLSYRIYQHNWRSGLLQPRYPQPRSPDMIREDSRHDARFLLVAGNMDENGLLAPPRAEDRLLSYVREFLWQQDHEQPNPDFLQAAVAAGTTVSDFEEFRTAIKVRNWTLQADANLTPGYTFLNLEARLWVERQERKQGTGRQGFVAMWFDEDLLSSAYEQGFKVAIANAGYEPYLVRNDKYHSDRIDNRIVAAIRRSRFVVADFTSGTGTDEHGNKVRIARGGVYFEAGFAEGLGIPVIYTCHKDSIEYLHFDTRQIHHLVWETPEDLANLLQDRIEGQLGQGPIPVKRQGAIAQA